MFATLGQVERSGFVAAVTGAVAGLNCCTYGTVERGISEAGMGSPEKCTVGKELWTSYS